MSKPQRRNKNATSTPKPLNNDEDDFKKPAEKTLLP